ncbi:MAG: monovalent cation/H+ antiporter complex subunit F [Clostridiales bacterium]|nr:monovalent cation/H+ antiporter complex subunit F [Clostridiales bacterium]
MQRESVLLIFAMIFLSITIFFCLIRAILGPRTTDRLVAVNLIGIKGIILILMLGAYLYDSQFMDIALVYALLSFLTVVCLAKNLLASAKKKGGNTDGND